MSPAAKTGNSTGGNAAPVRQTGPRDTVAAVAHALLLTGAAAAVFLVAGAPQGAEGIFLVCCGVALVCCPPRVKVDGWLYVWLAALVACASLALLPARWFPLPAWRTALEHVPAIALPSTLTPVPWQTAYWLVVLASSAFVGLFMLAQPVRSARLRSLALGAVLVCGCYAALSIYAHETGWRYPFTGGATFGFFENRNHAATFLITGSLVAVGLLGVTLRDGRWVDGIVAGGCLAVCVAGLFFYSTSRGGIVFLLAGMLIWIGGLGRKHRHGPLLISCAALLLAGSMLFLLSHGEAQPRIVALVKHLLPADSPPVLPAADALPSPAGAAAPGASEMPFDARITIYEDTLPLIRSFPITGTGLGTFALVFPQYRERSLSEWRVVHPESDWLMLITEAGIPALVCVLALIWLLARRLPALRGHPYWPLRWGCVAAAAAGLLHGLVDVPAHHVPLGWWIMIIAGLGLQAGQEGSRRSLVQHAAFVAGGVGMFFLGVQLIRAEWFGGTPLPPFAAGRMQTDLVRAYEHHDLEGAARIARRATHAFPMDETFYYEWGALVQPFADSDADVDAAFRAERLLNPGPASIPFRQGEAWTRYDAARAAALWLEALARRTHLDHAAGVKPSSSAAFYGEMLARAAGWPDLQRRLLVASDENPALLWVWLENARPELVADECQKLSNDERFLRRFDAEERRHFLWLWYHTGDGENLTRFVDQHEDWREAAWPVRLRQWVDAQEFERAVHEAAEHYQVSLAIPSPGTEGGAAGMVESEKVDPVAAFHAYWSSGNTVAARRVLAEAAGADGDQVPPDVWRLQAAVAVQNLDWAGAWQSLSRYIKAEHPRELW